MPHESISPLKAVLDNEQLDALNAALPWMLYMVDGSGRRVGAGAIETGFDERALAFTRRFDLRDKSVLEPGCLEGVMTVALCAAGAIVTAFDARATCVTKAFARCLAFGYYPRLLLLDAREMLRLGGFDAIFDSGLLYHLPEPAAHLRAITKMSPLIGLHTHAARAPGDERFRPADVATHEGYEGQWFMETPEADEWSGMQPKSFWPTRLELRRLIDDCGFDCETIFERCVENGWDGLYFLTRRSSGDNLGSSDGIEAELRCGSCADSTNSGAD